MVRPAIEAVEVVRNDEAAQGVYELELEAPGVARSAQPGQFVNLTPPAEGWALLRRPFSIAARSGSRIVLLIKIVGKATQAMRRLIPGDKIEALGPLGNGFKIPNEKGESYLLAGGYGLAGVSMLAERLAAGRNGGEVTIVYGARSAAELIWKKRLEGIKGLSVEYATEDGSEGFKGTAVGRFKELIKNSPGRGRAIYACGPMGMLKALWLETRSDSMQVAVEARMACGIGICQGCAVPMAGRKGHDKYTRACKEGPVYEASRIDWESWRI